MLRRVSLVMFAILTGCSSSDSSAPALPQPVVDAQAEAAPDGTSPDGGQPEAAEAAAPIDAQPEVGDEACTLSKPYSSSNATCNGCAEKNCCALINVCYADQGCDDTYVNCILACALMADEDAGDAGIAACMEDCANQAPEGKKEYDSAIGCADSKCKNECQ